MQLKFLTGLMRLPVRQIILISSLIGFITPCFAQSAFEGFYGQIGIGYESSAPNFSGGTLNKAPISYTVSGGNVNGFAGTAALGYYFGVSQSFLLGIGAEYSPINSSTTNYSVTLPAYKYSESDPIYKKNSYNIYISPAYVIDKDKLAYAKVGYSSAVYNSQGSDNTFSGYSLGLGYRQIITGNWYGFGEINYTSYGNQSYADDASGTFNFKVTNALVGVGYKF